MSHFYSLHIFFLKIILFVEINELVGGEIVSVAGSQIFAINCAVLFVLLEL